METDQDVAALDQKLATSFRIHAAYPEPEYPVFDSEQFRLTAREHVEMLLAQAGCPDYSITEVWGCWEHRTEPGLVIERIYPEGRTSCPRGFRAVAEQLQKEWRQEEVWITRTVLDLTVIR